MIVITGHLVIGSGQYKVWTVHPILPNAKPGERGLGLGACGSEDVHSRAEADSLG